MVGTGIILQSIRQFICPHFPHQLVNRMVFDDSPFRWKNQCGMDFLIFSGLDFHVVWRFCIRLMICFIHHINSLLGLTDYRHSVQQPSVHREATTVIEWTCLKVLFKLELFYGHYLVSESSNEILIRDGEF